MAVMQIHPRLRHYAELMRLHKPIGLLLLLWPTLWALWLAGAGHPDPLVLLVFVAGVVLMRSAGCVVNDLADRHVDGHVTRTRERPLVSGNVTIPEACLLAAILSAIAFSLVFFCNWLTVILAVVGAVWVVVYPLMKRVTHLPQLGLGVAFSWSVPMAFAAENQALGLGMGILFITSCLWPIIYDTQYAMVDREDDRKIGVKSTAVLWGMHDVLIISLLQLLFIMMLVGTGYLFQLHAVYYASIAAVSFLFIYQMWLIKERDPKRCFSAFLNNHWVGCLIFIGIFLSYQA